MNETNTKAFFEDYNIGTSNKQDEFIMIRMACTLNDLRRRFPHINFYVLKISMTSININLFLKRDGIDEDSFLGSYRVHFTKDKVEPIGLIKCGSTYESFLREIPLLTPC